MTLATSGRSSSVPPTAAASAADSAQNLTATQVLPAPTASPAPSPEELAELEATALQSDQEAAELEFKRYQSDKIVKLSPHEDATFSLVLFWEVSPSEARHT